MPELPDDKKATEHLANERTFLAWVRTSIAIVSLGFVVAKFGIWLQQLGARLSPGAPIRGTGFSGPIGISMIAIGGLLALASAWRFHVVNKQIDAGLVKVDRGMVWTVALLMAAVAALMVIYLSAST